MHELPVTQSLLEIALRHAESAGAQRITALNIKIGQLASIVDDSVQFYWEIIAKETKAEGAKLVFNRVPAKLQCLNCGQQFPLDESDYTCPVCKSEIIKVISGREFSLESIDVD